MIAFRNGNEQGFFTALWQAGLSEYDDLKGIQWEWQAVDGVMSDPPLSPVPRPEPTRPIAANREPNVVLLTDGAGIPLALVVDGANRHDVRLRSRHP